MFQNKKGIFRTPHTTTTTVHVPTNVKCCFIREDKTLQVIINPVMFCNMRNGILDVLHNLPLRTVTYIIHCICKISTLWSRHVDLSTCTLHWHSQVLNKNLPCGFHLCGDNDSSSGLFTFLHTVSCLEMFHLSQNAFRRTGFTIRCSELPMNICNYFCFCPLPHNTHNTHTHTKNVMLVRRHSQSNCWLVSVIFPVSLLSLANVHSVQHTAKMKHLCFSFISLKLQSCSFLEFRGTNFQNGGTLSQISYTFHNYIFNINYYFGNIIRQNILKWMTARISRIHSTPDSLTFYS
jgi:hypothetical protein